MNILCLDEKKIFVLQTPNTTYVMGVDDDGVLCHIYWGDKISDISHFSLSHPNSQWLQHMGDNYAYTPEYPADGRLAFEEPCIDVEFTDGVKGTRLIYDGYTVKEEKNTSTLSVRLKDEHYPLTVVLHYTLYRNLDLIQRNAVIENTGTEEIVVTEMKSAAVYVPCKHTYTLTHFAGNWGAEYQPYKADITQSKIVLENRRGTASDHQHVPFFMLNEKDAADETYGEVWFGTLVWSGNFRIIVENNQAGQVSVTAGISSYHTTVRLMPCESFETPALVVGYTNGGYEKVSKILYDYQRDYLMPPLGSRYEAIPVIYNSWYPFEFRIDQDNILGLIEKCREIGIELFVIDDGWMRGRTDDLQGLGDWYADEKRFPKGLKYISEQVKKAGLKFGLWVEPEMVNERSQLYKDHPDWILQYKTREKTPSRNQYVLNLAREDVFEFVLDTVERLITENDLDYLKWDMNRYISEAGWDGASEKEQEEIYIRYTRNLYRVWETISQRHPDVLLEDCASGGGRSDYGMLRYCNRINRSDNSDPVDVLKLHEGFSFLFQPKIAGGAGNISASPNNMNGRVTPLKYRAHIGMTGAMSVGINLLTASAQECDELKKYITEFKEIRKVTHNAYVYRLYSAFRSPFVVWQYVSFDGSSSVVFAFGNGLNWRTGLPKIRLRGLIPDKKYIMDGVEYSGEYLMNFGIEIKLQGDYDSAVVRINV